MLNKDTLLTAILAASGAKQTVKYDDYGNPSVMTRVPKFNVEDIDPSLGSGPHPAFIVNGVAKNELYIGTYPAIVDNGLALSIPGQVPAVNINFDNAKKACKNKGAGWHLMTAWEWAAVALWCAKNGFQPRGNTNYGRSHEATYETGTRPDNENPGVAAGDGKILSGSGAAAWRHDGTHQGISDLVGNVWEWNDGLKIVDGRLYFPADNNFNGEESGWTASGVYFDASAGPGDRDGYAASGVPVLSTSVTKYSEIPTPAGGEDVGNFDAANRGGESGWRAMGLSTAYDGLPLETRPKLAQLLIAPEVGVERRPAVPGQRRAVGAELWHASAAAGRPLG